MKQRGCCVWIVLRALLLIVVLVGTGWLIYQGIDRVRPTLSPIPVTLPATGLVLNGSGFGAAQGQGSVTLTTTEGKTRSLDVTKWQDNQIAVHSPNVEAGTISVSQSTWIGMRSSYPRDFMRGAPDLPTPKNAYLAPLEDASPWPSFRRDSRNTGHSSITGSYNGSQPWLYPTGKGIFSTPVIDGRGIIYVGSADHYFYALNPDGTLNWKYETAEIIDSAAVLGRVDAKSGLAPVTFISGDGKMYHFRTDPGIENVKERQLWTFEAELRPGVSFNRWFEGNVALGPDGTLFAGNTNFNYYAVNPDGSLKWVYPTTSNNWSQAAFGSDGSIYWASLDTYVRAVSPQGRELWKKMTLGFIAASAAVGSDGTVYIGSFDSNFYALDPLTGSEKWHFTTGDHIYSSAALGAGPNGSTSAIFVGSADGFMYALSPDGKLLWKFDSGDTIRSSPAVAYSPEGKEVVYFGSGNGKLFALNAEDGSLRWSFNTTPLAPELRDRNDLNGSPALGENGIYIGGEHGYVAFVPYDYCLKAVSDDRCQAGSKTNAIADGSRLVFVTPGGNAQEQFPAELPVSSMVTLRLEVHQGGQTLPARLCDAPVGCPADALVVNIDPAVPLQVDHSADGRHIFIRPKAFFRPDTRYSLEVRGRYYSGGLRLGNLALGGSDAGFFVNTFQFRTPKLGEAAWPLGVDANRTGAFEWTRLAAPLPAMLPSLNQIGFDYIDWIVGTVALTPPDLQKRGKVVLWAIGAKHDAQGRLVADPTSDFTLPLGGSYQGTDFMLSNQSFRMPITGISIPFNLLELRGQIDADGTARPGAALFADTEVMSIPKFGPYLVVAGLANNWYQKLLVAGTYVTRPYPQGSPANLAPKGVTVENLSFRAPAGSQPGKATARLKLAAGAAYPADQHRAGILLVDPATLDIVFMDYHANLKSQTDPNGNIASIELNIPTDIKLPASVRAYVLLDVFPILHKEFP